MAANPPFTSLRLVQLDHIVENLTEEAYKDLQNTLSNLAEQPDENKKRALLQHLNATKQRLQRLHILVQWCHKSPAMAECKRVLEVSATHADAFRDAADQLAYLHGELVYSKAPPYDVPTAMHVLSQGAFSVLPSIIESEAKVVAPSAAAAQSKARAAGPKVQAAENAALARLDFLMRSKLLEEGLPAGLRLESIKKGETVLSSTSGQYTVTLSLVPAPSDEVTLAKWVPDGAAAAAAAEGDQLEDQEVVQPAAETAADVENGTAGAAGGADEVVKMDVDAGDTGNEPATAAPEAVAVKRSEASQWRWRLLSFKLLPSQPTALLPPKLVAWLTRNVEDRMWGAADIKRLIELGKSEAVVVPPPPLTRRQREQRQKELDDAGRAAPAMTLDLSSQRAGKTTSSGGRTLSRSLSQQQQQKSKSSAGGGDAKQEAEEEIEKQLGEPGVIPDWAQCPLAAMHAVLEHTSSKVALELVVMEEARGLIESSPKGPWSGGNLKTSKIVDGFGVKLAIWPKIPVLSYQEVVSIGAGEPEHLEPIKIENGVEKVPKLGCAIEVHVPTTNNGTIECICHPSLHSPMSGAALSLSPFTSSGVLSTAELLKTAGAGYATLQLAGIRGLITRPEARKEELKKVLGGHWAVEQVELPRGSDAELLRVQGSTSSTNDSVVLQNGAVPALQCSVNNQAIFLLHLSTTDGQPLLTLAAPFAEKDAAIALTAKEIVQKGQNALAKRLEAVLLEQSSSERSRAMVWAAAVAEVVVDTWKQLAAAERKLQFVASAVKHDGLIKAALPRFLQGVELSGGADAEKKESGRILGDDNTTAVLRISNPTVAMRKLSNCLVDAVPVGKQGSLVGFIIADVSDCESSLKPELQYAVCWATPRGVPTALRSLIAVPKAEVLVVDGHKRPGSGGVKRKREREEDTEGANDDHSVSAAASVKWQELVNWCRSQLVDQQLEAQLEAAEFKVKGPDMRVVMLAETWLSSGDADADMLAGAEVIVSLEDEVAESGQRSGDYVVQLRGEKFRTWKATLEAHGIAVNSTEDHHQQQQCGVGQIVFVDEGLDLQCSLQNGHNAADAVVLAACALRTHTCASNLAAALSARGSNTAAAAVVTVESVSLDSINLKVSDSATGSVSSVVTIQWNGNGKMKAASGGAGAEAAGGAQPMMRSMRSMAASSKAETKPSKDAMICSLTASPNATLPESFVSLLESQLQLSNEEAFLKTLQGACIGAAALQAQVLSSAGQRAAGLLPGALVVEHCTFDPKSQNGREVLGECELLVRQLGRALQLRVWFEPSGEVAVRARQLPPQLQDQKGANADNEEAEWLKNEWLKLELSAIEGEHEVFEGVSKCETARVAGGKLATVLEALLRAVARRE